MKRKNENQKESAKVLFDAFLSFMNDYKDEVKDEVKEMVDILLNDTHVPKLFYTLKELEQMTGISFLALKGRIKRGTLIATNEGNVTLVRKDEVDRLIEKLNQQIERNLKHKRSA